MKLTRRDFTAGLAVVLQHLCHPQRRGAGRDDEDRHVRAGDGSRRGTRPVGQNGAKLALAAVNKAGGVLGKQIELVIEDDQTTNPGIVLAFSKLAAQQDIVAFLGSIRSTQVLAMAPDVLKLGKPVMIGGTNPDLTHMGNPWLFRFRPNDNYSGRVIADYGVNTLGKKKWRSFIRPTRSARRRQGAVGRIDQARCAACARSGLRQPEPGFTPVVLAVKQSGADVLSSYFTFENDLAFLPGSCASSASTFPGLGRPPWLRFRRPSLPVRRCMALTACRLREDSSEASKAFGKAYREAYKTAPDNQSAWPYDAITILSAAINKVGSTDPAKVREAILAIKKHPAPKVSIISTRTATACTATMS